MFALLHSHTQSPKLEPLSCKLGLNIELEVQKADPKVHIFRKLDNFLYNLVQKAWLEVVQFVGTYVCKPKRIWINDYIGLVYKRAGTHL